MAAVVDAYLSNKGESATFSVDPAVDLSVDQPAAATVTLNGSTSVDLALSNDASLAASNARVTITLDAGLAASTPNWTLGSCSVTGQTVECLAPNFNAQSSSVLTLELTGSAAGQQTYSVSVAASEPDIDTANNSVSGSITVNAPPAASGGGGGGGGGAGAALLALLPLVLYRRRFPKHG